MNNEIYQTSISIIDRSRHKDGIREHDRTYTVTEENNGFIVFMTNVINGKNNIEVIQWHRSRAEAIEHAVDLYRARKVELKMKGIEHE